MDLDIFALPGLGCITAGDYYTKLWAAIVVPTILIGLIIVEYLGNYKRLHLDHIPNPELDDMAKDHLKMFHHKSRKAKHAGNDDWEHNGIFKSHKTGGDAHGKAMAERDIHHDDLSHHDDKEEEMKLRYKLLHDKANMQQQTISMIFMVIFLCYPSITNKIFGFFVCYQISDETLVEQGVKYGKPWENDGIGYLVDDYSVSCHDEKYVFYIRNEEFLI